MENSGTSLSYKNITLHTFDASIGGQLWDGTNGALNNFGKTIESANEVTLTEPTKLQRSYSSCKHCK
jgi:hypothetical protein